MYTTLYKRVSWRAKCTFAPRMQFYYGVTLGINLIYALYLCGYFHADYPELARFCSFGIEVFAFSVMSHNRSFL